MSTGLAAARRAGAAGLLLPFMAAAAPAAASSFNITPIRVELGVAHRTAVLTLRNEEDTPVVVQVRTVRWTQRDGADELDATRDLLTTPPVLQIPAHGEQLVRVALREPASVATELDYRLLFEEVPQAAPEGFTGLRVALRLSVPVFVAPSGQRASAEMKWHATWISDTQVELSASNGGTGHLQVMDFDAQFSGAAVPVHAAVSKYVLPGSQMRWMLAAPPGAQASASLRLHGSSDQGEFSANAAADP